MIAAADLTGIDEFVVFVFVCAVRSLFFLTHLDMFTYVNDD